MHCFGRNRGSTRSLFRLFSCIVATTLVPFTIVSEVHRRSRRATASLLLLLRGHDDGSRSWTALTALHEDAEEEEEEEERRILLTEILRGRVPFPTVGVDRLRYRPGSGLRMNSTEALRHCRVDPGHRISHLGHGRAIGNKTFVSASERHKLLYRNVPKSASR
jgi:hypothetical protein